MRPVRVTPPALAPVLLADVQDQSRENSPETNALLQSYIDAAVSYLDGPDGLLGRFMVDQVWRLRFPRWQMSLSLPFPDVSAATVTYLDAAGTSQELNADLYEIVESDLGAMIVLRPGFDAPSLSAQDSLPITVTFTAGYGSPDDVPDALKQAIRLLVAHWFENREAVVVGTITATLPMGVKSLIANHRWVSP